MNRQLMCCVLAVVGIAVVLARPAERPVMATIFSAKGTLSSLRRPFTCIGLHSGGGVASHEKSSLRGTLDGFRRLERNVVFHPERCGG